MTMKWLRSSNNKLDDTSYWETHSDLMTALLLIILLFLMLLILSLLNLDEEDPHPNGIDDITAEEYIDYINSKHKYDYEFVEDRIITSGGGGGNDAIGQSLDDFKYEVPTDNLLDKSAVYVVAVDAETEKPIKMSDIVFELYTSLNYKVALNTYYPSKIEYTSYATTKDGSFYLPEKIDSGTYVFKNTMSPYGYDLAKDYSFTLDKGYDWSDPYICKIPLSPCRNSIYVRTVDSATKAGVAGAEYEVYAAENIVTADNTMKYEKGELVDTIIIDSEGDGKSKELYLGKYTLKQSKIADGYAGDLEDIEVAVESKDFDTEIHEISCEKSIVTVKLVDEMYTTVTLDGAVYELMNEDRSQVIRRYTTGINGEFKMADLERGKVYHLVQKNGPHHDIITENVDHKIVVDNKGRVDLEAQPLMVFTNRIVHVIVDTRSSILRRRLHGYTMTLQDKDGEVVTSWESSAIDEDLTGFAPGEYNIVCEEQSKNVKTIYVKDTDTIQRFTYTVTDMREVIAASVLAFMLVVFMTAYIIIMYKTKKRVTKE